MPLPHNIAHAFSVDVEDWYQSTIDPSAELSNRFETSTRRVLDLLDRMKTKGTFFMLGLAARAKPALAREIASRGHEVQSHGNGHLEVFRQTPDEFREDVRTAKALLEDQIGAEVFGYRAPSFSIDERTPWALDILAETGHRYDSSIFPIKMRRYGVAGYPLEPRVVTTPSGLRIVEAPVACVESMGRRIPVGGGGYVRLYPRWLLRRWWRGILRAGRPGILYMHPYEFDPTEMKESSARLSLKTRLHQGLGRKGFSAKIEALLQAHPFGPLRDVIAPRLAELTR